MNCGQCQYLLIGIFHSFVRMKMKEQEGMKQNKIILSLGSNRESAANIRQADELLCAYLTSVSFSEAVYTEAVGLPEGGKFLNQVAIGYTKEHPEVIRQTLKQMERLLGRTPEGKANGCIPIDIDLLQWNEQVLKPADLEREYIVSLLRTLG
jgi:2-amino-4-hydroxy-6-hydroxymethyldihydropteridine diphosphokinase